MQRSLLSLFALIAAAVIPAAGAQAAGVPIAAGARPAVAVDSSGTAHIAFERPSGAVGYCKLPRGAATCAVDLTLPGPLNSPVGALNIFALSPTDVQIYGSALCGPSINNVLRYASVNGGSSFTSSVCKISNNGSVSPTTAENLITSDGRYLATDLNVFESNFYAFPSLTTTVAPANTAAILSPGDSTGEGSTGMSLATSTTGAIGTHRLVASSAYDEGIRYSVYPFDADGSTTVHLNDASLWQKDKLVPDSAGTNEVPHAASGPSGAFIAYNAQPSSLNDALTVRRLDPSTNTFGAATLVDGTALDTAMLVDSLTQDAGGRLHLTWTNGTNLRYALSTDGGASFTTLGSLADVSATTTYEIDSSAAPDGQGFAVYNYGQNIYAAPLVATPDPVVTPPSTTPGTTTPAGTGGAATTPDPSANITSKTVTVSGGTVTLESPKACVPKGGTYNITLKFAKQKKKGSVFVKVFRVDFSVNKKVVKKDKKAPFKQTFKIKPSAKSGSKITVGARAYIKVKKGKSPTKSISATVRVCG